MEKHPKVSVLLPVFNGQEFLNESIDSILSQTYENLELLLINDGSIDHTEEIILSKKDKRIKYFKNERNQGIVKSLNKGLYFAKGEFIGRMDADDVSLPYRLERQIGYLLENPDVDILGAAIMLNDQEGLKDRTNSETIIENKFHEIWLLKSNTLAHPTVVFKKQALAQKKLYYDKESLFAEDYKLWADSSINKLNIESLTDKLLFYRVHEKQLSQQKYWKQIKMARAIQLSLGNFYFGDVLQGREIDYIKLINQLPLNKENEISMRASFVQDLISFNDRQRIFDKRIFAEVFNTLITVLNDKNSK